jgi:hypothetical protein
MNRSRFLLLALPALLVLPWLPRVARSFCGFYVASGTAKLWNQASRVVLVRDGDRTVITMASDYRGEPKQFALVVPVPTVLQKGQVHVGDAAVVDHLDAYSAPRLVEYTDDDPCARRVLEESALMLRAGAPASVMADAMGSSAQGVHVEARYTVGEYDIVILSATESHGLQNWLVANGYTVPAVARNALASYIKQGAKFFVAKVNLAEQQKLGFTQLRPIQIAFESPKFMLPIHLGMVNADGPQELFVYAITRTGRVETTNYRTVKLPSDLDVPEFVQQDFPKFYRDAFATTCAANDRSAVITEYAWNMGWCDPCASAPLTPDELRGLGVFWMGASAPRGTDAFLTRLHVRYDREHFPEDLAFQITQDTQNFQGRYVIRHEWKGEEDCPAVAKYRASLRERRRQEAENVVRLTGWSLSDVRSRMAVNDDWSTERDRLTWWQRMWK